MITIKNTVIFLFIFVLVNSNLVSQQVKLGIDVLIENDFDVVQNKRILLLTNYTGRNRFGRLTIEIFKETDKCEIIGLLTPEHGFYSAIPAGKAIADDFLFNLPVYSLYGSSKKPNKEIISQCDAIVIDLQDIGIRSYTYISTICKTIEAAAESSIEVIILDRPNPIGGQIIDGNIVEKSNQSFVSIIPIPYIHGCTIAEIAIMANEEGWINNKSKKKANIKVVKMKNWDRWMIWEDTKLKWYPTSPNIPTVDAVRGAATLGIFGELGIFSIGIGTSLPFQYIGSPLFSTELILEYIEKEKLKGLLLIPTQYYPFFGMYKEKVCNGFLLIFESNNEFKPYTYGFRIALYLKKAYPELFNPKKIAENAKKMFNKVTGNDLIYKYLFEEESNEKLLKELSKGLEDFIKIRSRYLLYD